MATTAQLVTAARLKLLETGSELITDATIYLYGDFAQQDIAKRVFPNNSVKAATVTFANGIGTLPTDFGSLYGDAYVDAYNTFPAISIGDFGRITGGNAVTIRGGSLYVYPTTTASLTVPYYPSYPALSAAQNPTIDPYFHELIIYGILMRAFEDLQDPELASFYSGKYEAMMKQKKSDFANYEDGSTRGGVLLNGIQIVGDNRGSGSPNHW